MEMLNGIRDGSWILAVFGIVSIGFVGLLVWKRTRSTHSLMVRLWRLFHGKKECKDAVVSKFLDEQAALMEFRFITGVPVRTHKQVHAIIEWTNKNNEDIGDVAACGSYFDIENAELKKEDELPKKLHLFGRLMVAFVLFLAVVFSALTIVLDSAALQIKKSGTFFLLSSEYAKPLWSGQRLFKTQCLDSKVPLESPFGVEDTQLICDIFKDEGLSAYLKKTVTEQRVAATIGMLFFFAFCWDALRVFLMGVRAREMFKRLAATPSNPLAYEP
jgi:hypothetical protein